MTRYLIFMKYKNTLQAHTPGPWKVAETYAGRDGRSVNIYPVSSSGEFGNTEGEHAPIAQVRVQGSDFHEANARLIAAAPDLLEIAKAYRNLLRTMASTDYEVRTFEHIQDVIRKIEGE